MRRRIAGNGGIEQSEHCFGHQRTHTSDLVRSFDLQSAVQRQPISGPLSNPSLEWAPWWSSARVMNRRKIANGAIEAFERIATLIKNSDVGRTLEMATILHVLYRTIDVVLFVRDRKILQVFYDPIFKRSEMG
jgi:hypothetical protein